MTRIRALGSTLLFLIGCGGSPSPTTTTPTSGSGVAEAGQAGDDTGEASEELAEHHRHHHHGGFAMFVAMSLETLNVDDAQRDAIVKIQADMHAKMQAAHDAEKDVLLALADGVAAGSVDQAKLDPAIAKLSAASADVSVGVAGSLQALHDTLTPPQRQALVDKVEAHLSVWHKSNDGKGGHLARLAKDLGLSPDQVEKIRGNFDTANAAAPKYDPAEATEHMKVFAESFTADHFDAAALTAGRAVNGHMATFGMNRTVNLYKAAAPLLSPDQRTKAAESIRQHANYKRSDAES